MNMFLHELKSYKKSTFIWTCSLSAMVILFFLALFPTFSKDAGEIKKLLEGYPEAVIKAFGLTVDISSLLGFYSYVFMFVLLCGAIQAMNLGISIISKEVRQKTADFLLTKPVTRKQIITSKLLAALTSLIITNVVYLTVSSFIAQAVKNEPFSLKIFIMISITLFFIQLIFMSLGVIVSVVFPKIKSVISVSLATVFGFFIISMFDSVIEDEMLRYITPFKYFDTVYIISNGAYETPFIILGIVFIIVSISASYFIYSRKDIHAA
jgi:ABC-2 type transport system permease protein